MQKSTEGIQDAWTIAKWQFFELVSVIKAYEQ